MMHVLVIGRTGQLARALEGCRMPDARMSFLGRDALDLCQPGRIAGAVRAAGPDLVVNAAAYTAVDKAEDEPGLAHSVNAVAVGELAAAAETCGAPFLHISTDYVYDGRKSASYVETDPVSPINAYGASKLAGEMLAMAANPRTVILRTAWVYAPWGRNFLRTMLRLGAECRELRVVDDQIGSPTSALDLADAITALAPAVSGRGATDPVWGRFHYAGKGATSWAGFAGAIFAGAAARGLLDQAPTVAPIPSAAYPTAAARPANSVLDCSEFERVFGLKTIHWKDALARVLDRLKEA